MASIPEEYPLSIIKSGNYCVFLSEIRPIRGDIEVLDCNYRDCLRTVMSKFFTIDLYMLQTIAA